MNITTLNASCNACNLDPRPGNYYVSAVDAGRLGLLLGPFATHAAALAQVATARQIAHAVDPFACFYAFGTVRIEHYTRPGCLNHLLETIDEPPTV